MATSLRTNAIVLRRTNYGEADRILSVLTPAHGKLSVMARGVRREKSRLAGGIELFAVCDLSLHLGKGEMATLTGAKIKQFYDAIILDYDRMQFAYEAIKKVASAAENLDEPEFYQLLLDTLAALNRLDVNLTLVQIWFYLRLASLLGNELNTTLDNNGMQLVDGARYGYDRHNQVFVYDERGAYGPEQIKILRLMAHNPPEIIARITGVDEYIAGCLDLALAVAKT
jgi:DNA repair protein RecO (recombination protein O)